MLPALLVSFIPTVLACPFVGFIPYVIEESHDAFRDWSPFAALDNFRNDDRCISELIPGIRNITVAISRHKTDCAHALHRATYRYNRRDTPPFAHVHPVRTMWHLRVHAERACDGTLEFDPWQKVRLRPKSTIIPELIFVVVVIAFTFALSILCESCLHGRIARMRGKSLVPAGIANENFEGGAANDSVFTVSPGKQAAVHASP